MENNNITYINYENGALSGANISEGVTTIGKMAGFFKDEKARAAIQPDTIAYRVQIHSAVTQADKPGTLYYGVTFLNPGMVGNEYYMTKGHFHQKPTAEYYWCIQGQGKLLIMDKDRNYEVIEMSPGTLHYIPEEYAHRVVNTGETPLIFGACWPADAGHDYQSIVNQGFPIRMINKNGKPVIEATI